MSQKKSRRSAPLSIYFYLNLVHKFCNRRKDLRGNLKGNSRRRRWQPCDTGLRLQVHEYLPREINTNILFPTPEMAPTSVVYDVTFSFYSGRSAIRKTRLILTANFTNSLVSCQNETFKKLALDEYFAAFFY